MILSDLEGSLKEFVTAIVAKDTEKKSTFQGKNVRGCFIVLALGDECDGHTTHGAIGVAGDPCPHDIITAMRALEDFLHENYEFIEGPDGKVN